MFLFFLDHRDIPGNKHARCDSFLSTCHNRMFALSSVQLLNIMMLSNHMLYRLSYCVKTHEKYQKTPTTIKKQHDWQKYSSLYLRNPQMNVKFDFRKLLVLLFFQYWLFDFNISCMDLSWLLYTHRPELIWTYNIILTLACVRLAIHLINVGCQIREYPSENTAKFK